MILACNRNKERGRQGSARRGRRPLGGTVSRHPEEAGKRRGFGIIVCYPALATRFLLNILHCNIYILNKSLQNYTHNYYVRVKERLYFV